MRKFTLLILVLLLSALCACAAADNEYALGAISGTMSFNENNYVVLTPENLADHPDLIATIGKTQEELLADWAARGVVLQAWSKDTKSRTSVEISVFQDELSQKYYDLETLTPAIRRQYQADVKNQLKSAGYKFNETDFKLHSKSGHYYVVSYTLPDDSGNRHGVLRRTIRNGWNLVMNYEVYGRQVSRTDKERSQKLVNAISIETVAAPAPAQSQAGSDGTGSQPAASTVYTGDNIPAGATERFSVTVQPPEKTNTGVFTVEGTAYPGSEVIVVAGRLSSSSGADAHQYPTVATKAGNFKAKVTLPSDGVYTITINNYIGETPIADSVWKQVSYSKTCLPVTMDADIPEQLTTDELVISGTTDGAVTIQCIVKNGITTFDKTIRTNKTGRFRFKVDTSVEADYEIVLSFSKKNLDSERLKWNTTRKLTAADNQSRTAKNAIHPSYGVLVKKLDTYIGQTMVYTAHIVSVEEAGEEWIITAALKLNKGQYSNYLVFMASEDPGLAAGSKVKLYGKCIGPYQFQTEEGDSTCPGFDFLFSE